MSTESGVSALAMLLDEDDLLIKKIDPTDGAVDVTPSEG